MKSRFFVFLAALILALGGCNVAPTTTETAQPGPKLGLQAYTFRQLSFAETLDRAQALGIRYLQAYPGQRLAPEGDATFHHTMDAATQARVLELLRAKNITLTSYGVVNGKDEAEWRQIFAFAKAMGLSGITCEPEQTVLPLVAKLAKENRIKVSLHNHPTPSRYADPAVALAAIKKYRGWVGICADTGHWARSNFEPVAALKQAEGRIFELHFKDLTEPGVKAAHDVPWGTGASRAAAQIAELRRQKFDGVAYIEYEHATPTLVKDVELSIAFFNAAVTAPMADLVGDRVPPPGYSNDVSAVWSERQTGYGAPKWPSPKPLFDASLSHAVMTSGQWKPENGTLVPQGASEIWTREATWQDFVLSLEFRCVEGSEGKIHVRAPADAKGVDVQILQGDAADDKMAVGAIYGVLGPTRAIAIKPGEWYRYVIKVKGQQVVVLLNGEVVTKLNVFPKKPATVDPANPPPPEPTPIPIPAAGRIGLQSGAKPVEFRNVRIEKL